MKALPVVNSAATHAVYKNFIVLLFLLCNRRVRLLVIKPLRKQEGWYCGFDGRMKQQRVGLDGGTQNHKRGAVFN